MAEIRWIKLNVDMFDDEKIKVIQSMPDGDALLVIWIKLITLAGKTNDGGYIYIADNIPYTEEMLSVIMNKPLLTIRLAIDTFTKLQMIDTDTRGIYLVNFEKHQSLEKMAKIKEQTRKRVAKHRESRKELSCNADVTQDVTQCNATDIDKDKDKDKEKDKDKYKEILSSISDDGLRELYQEYIKMRKLIKSPMTVKALTMLVNKVNSLESTIERQKMLLETAIMNNWKSVYPLKDEIRKGASIAIKDEKNDLEGVF
jgi:predicted phage replisome organizer